MDPVLKFQNVSVNYTRSLDLFGRNKIEALKDVSFELYSGETLGVIGKNGAGKSTLLKLLAGIINPDSGSVETADVRVQLLSLQAGFLPQLTGRENAVLSGMLLGFRRRQMQAMMDDIEEFADIGEIFDEPVRTYSNGMRARLGFAVASTADPDVLLIDEVLGVGDADFRQKSRQVIIRRMRSNKTVVLVSHNDEMVEKLCDRAVWIDQGCSRLVGETPEVIQAYRSA